MERLAATPGLSASNASNSTISAAEKLPARTDDFSLVRQRDECPSSPSGPNPHPIRTIDPGRCIVPSAHALPGCSLCQSRACAACALLHGTGMDRRACSDGGAASQVLTNGPPGFPHSCTLLPNALRRAPAAKASRYRSLSNIVPSMVLGPWHTPYPKAAGGGGAPRPSPLAPRASPVTSIFEANLVQRPTGAPHIGAWPPQAYLVQAPDDLALHPSQCKGPDIYPQPSLLCDRYIFPNLPTSTATCFLTACLLYSHPFALSSSARKGIRYPLVDCIEQFRPVGIARRFSLIWISRISSPPSPRHGIDLFAEGTRNKQLETRPGDGVTPRRFRAYRSDTNW